MVFALMLTGNSPQKTLTIANGLETLLPVVKELGGTAAPPAFPISMVSIRMILFGVIGPEVVAIAKTIH